MKVLLCRQIAMDRICVDILSKAVIAELRQIFNRGTQLIRYTMPHKIRHNSVA